MNFELRSHEVNAALADRALHFFGTWRKALDRAGVPKEKQPLIWHQTGAKHLTVTKIGYLGSSQNH